MAENFYTILTNVGKAKIANAASLGTKVNMTQLAVGDGNGAYYNPTENQTSLRREVWRGLINSINTDGQNPNWIVIEIVIPASDGGFTVREVGVFDADGDLIAVGKYPETYKPVLSDGSAKDLYIRMILEVTNASSVSLKIDPSVVLASKKYVDDSVNRVEKKVDGHVSNTTIHVTGEQKKNWDQALPEAKAYTDQQIALVTASGIPKLVSYSYVLTAAANDQKDFDIPLSTFVPETDTIIVVQNRTTLNKNDYSVVNDSNVYKVRLVEGVMSGTEIALLILKNVPQGAEGSISASVLADGTLGLSKLEKALQQKIELLSRFKKSRIGKDAAGIFTVTEYRRLDDTLFLRSTLSNPDARGNYQTNTEVYYKADGTTVDRTITITRTYDADGDWISEVPVT
jgi:Phage tail-collar fibre protein